MVDQRLHGNRKKIRNPKQSNGSTKREFVTAIATPTIKGGVNSNTFRVVFKTRPTRQASFLKVDLKLLSC
jgi:hypothetical protein